MIPLEKQVCSLELAQRLKELGVKQESLWAWYETTDRDDTPRLNRFDEHCTVCTLPKQAREEKYAAFTVSELGEMLPESYITERRLRGDWECSQHFTGTTQDVGTKEYTRNDVCMFANTEADARAKMLIYLVENKFVTLSGKRE